jgi:hypothetical protein
MAKRRRGKILTTRTTTTKTVRTTTRRVNSKPRVAKPAPKKGGHGMLIAGTIILIIILAAGAYLLMNPVLNPSQQSGQFSGQLSTMQGNSENLSLFYLANAPNYNFSLNNSWTIQVTDRNQILGTTIGQMTLSWNGQSKNLSIQNGIVDTGVPPTYAVTLSHSEFMAFSQALITKNTAAALAYYSAYYLTGRLKYTQVN